MKLLLFGLKGFNEFRNDRMIFGLEEMFEAAVEAMEKTFGALEWFFCESSNK